MSDVIQIKKNKIDVIKGIVIALALRPGLSFPVNQSLAL